MKRSMIFLLFTSLLLMSFSAFAQSDEEAIASRLKEGFQAVAQQDWEKVASLCTKDWTHLNHMGMRLDMAGLKAFISTHLSEHTIELSNLDTHVSSDGSMAWTTFDEKTNYKFDGNPVSESAVFTAVFVKKNDAWLMRTLQRTLVQPPPAMPEE